MGGEIRARRLIRVAAAVASATCLRAVAAAVGRMGAPRPLLAQAAGASPTSTTETTIAPPVVQAGAPVEAAPADAPPPVSTTVTVHASTSTTVACRNSTDPV